MVAHPLRECIFLYQMLTVYGMINTQNFLTTHILVYKFIGPIVGFSLFYVVFSPFE